MTVESELYSVIDAEDVIVALACTPEEWLALSEDDKFAFVRDYANSCVPAAKARDVVLNWISVQT